MSYSYETTGWDPEHMNWQAVPSHNISGIRRYVEDGVIPGGFLHAVLGGRLFEAAAYADSENIGHLGTFARWITEHLPSESFGGERMVQMWHQSGGLNGQAKGEQ